MNAEEPVKYNLLTPEALNQLLKYWEEVKTEWEAEEKPNTQAISELEVAIDILNAMV